MENPSTEQAPPANEEVPPAESVPPSASVETQESTDDAAPPSAVPGAPTDPRLKSAIPSSSTTVTAVPPRVHGTPGPSVGLPEGVTVPLAIDRSLFQGKLLDTLSRLPVHLINEALNEYDDAVKNKEGQIRNHGAYLYGVIKRYTSVQERALKGEGTGGLPMGPDLTPAVNERLQKLVDTGFCTEEEMNDKVKSKIRMLAEKDAIFAIDELSSVERAQIRNFGSYFMGIINRYMRGERDPSKGFSRHRGNSSYGHKDDRRHGDRGERDYRRRRDDSPSRGRSYQQERYGYSGGGNHYRRDRSRDRYDDDRRNNMGRSDYRRNTTNDHQHHRDSFRSQRYDDPRSQPASLPMGQQPQGAYSAGTTAAIPPPPPPRGTAQPPPQLGAYNQPQQTHYMNMRQQSQPPQQQPHQVFQQQVQPPQQQQQQQYVPQTVPQQNSMPGAYASAPASVPGVYTSSAPSGAPGSYPLSSASTGVLPSAPANPNISGGYSSSVPATGGFPTATTGTFNPAQQNVVPQSNFAQQQPVAGNQMATQQQASAPQNFLGSPSLTSQTPGWQSQGQQQQLPPDILGLADRAASAVQALASQNAAAAPTPAQMAPPSVPTATAQTNYYMNNAASQPPPQLSQSRGPRKTATLAELPTLVQFAVKNLQATGHVDGELDGGILAMIKELPEQSALAALERFSSIDTSTMRNKSAYLAGILRRDIEKSKRY